MKRPAIALAVLLLTILAGCGSGSAATGPGSSAPAVSTPTAGGPGAPTGTAGGSLEDVATGLVPAIVPTGDLEGGASAGAYAIALDGAFGRATASGQGACYWDGASPGATFTAMAGEPTELFGEHVDVQIGAGRSPELRRADGARYIPSGGTMTDPLSVGDVLVVRATQVTVDPADQVPVGEDKTSYYQPLGARTDTATLDVAVAWRCDQPTASPTATEAVDPTPLCPQKVAGTPGPIPTLVLTSGSDQVDGIPFSSDYTTCTDDGSADGEWNVPDTALSVDANAPLTLSLDGSGALFGVGAFYAPAGSDTPPTDPITLTVRPGTSPGTYVVDPPPHGDWALVVSTGIADADHGIVRDVTYIYRVKVKS
jgi:hypothetical protein